MTDAALPADRVTELENHITELLEAHDHNMAAFDEMAQVLQDIYTLCDTGQFKPDILLDFLKSGQKRHFMQYHNDYHQKAGSRH